MAATVSRNKRKLTRTALVVLIIAAGVLGSGLLQTARAEASSGSPPVWTELGPNAGAVNKVVLDPFSPNVVLAAGYDTGVYRSTDSGSSWVRSGVGLSDYRVTSLFASKTQQGAFYLTTNDGELSVSANDGANWKNINTCPKGYSALQFLVASHLRTRYYLVCGDELETSSDGTSWGVVNGPWKWLAYLQVAQSDGKMYLIGGTAEANPSPPSYPSPSLLFESYDNGSSWQSYPLPDDSLGSGILGVSPSDSKVLLFNGLGGVYMSGNSGSSWTKVISDGAGVTAGFVAFDSENGSKAYAGRGGFYMSNDFGKSFVELKNGGDIGDAAVDHSTGTMFLGEDHGVDISHDDGRTWQQLPNGMKNGLVYEVGKDPFNPNHMIAIRQDYGPAQTYDGGNSWQNIVNPHEEQGNLEFDPHSPGVVYITGAGVWKSTDYGRDFAQIDSGLPNSVWVSSNPFRIDSMDSSILWVSVQASNASESGIYRSTNGGSSWNKVIGFPGSVASDIQAQGNTIYAQDFQRRLWRTIDGGQTWSLLNTPGNVVSFKVDPLDSRTIFVVYWNAYVGEILATSRDGGSTFTDLSAPTSSTCCFARLLVQNTAGQDRIFLAFNGATSAGLHESLDSGSTWTDITGNINVTDIRDVEADPSNPDRIYLATYGEGVVVNQRITSVTIESSPTKLPLAPVMLVDNFPYYASSTFDWVNGDVHNMTAEFTISNATGTRYLFNSWNDSGPRSQLVTASSTAQTYIADFRLQHFLTVFGPYWLKGQGWYDNGSRVSITFQGVMNRTSGTGYRVNWYAVDSHDNQDVATTGPVNLSLIMSAPHSLNLNTVSQYHVSLGSGAVAALASITPPTINGDNYWYDWGEPITLVMNGVYGRSGGTGTMLTSYTINGETIPVSTFGAVTVFDRLKVFGPQTITATTATEYQLTLNVVATNALASCTPPAISGDNYWYQSGTSVSCDLHGVYGTSGNSRFWVSSYNFDGGFNTVEGRDGIFTTSSQIMNAPHTLGANSEAQYYVLVETAPHDGGSVFLTSGWYDASSHLNFSAIATTGWQFESWTGIGPNSYSGTASGGTFILSGPVNETALFYPGFTINVSNGGSVSYAWGNTRGTVRSGSLTTVFAPRNSRIVLTENPSPLLYSFSGWTGALSTSSQSEQIQLAGPFVTNADFSYSSLATLGTPAVAFAVVFMGFTTFIRRRRRAKTPKPT